MKIEPTFRPQAIYSNEKSIDDTMEERQKITTAVLLAAGMGYRLRPITDDAPKCLTEINGKTILQRMVDCLQQNGINKLVVVVGHMHDSIRDFFEASSADLNVEFVLNPDYLTTNNIYSLWLARESISEPFLLIESDLIFDASSLAQMLSPNKIAVSPILDWMEGSTVTVGPQGQIKAFHDSVNQNVRAESPLLKTVNMYSLSLSSWQEVEKRLDLHIASGRVNDYYEIVFSEMVRDGTLSFEAVIFDPESWYEVDTVSDLDEAERLFPVSSEPASKRLRPPR